MLAQQEVIRLLSKDPPPAQHEAFQILAAYIYCKSSRGNLPTETHAKLMSIQRRISARGLVIPSTSPIGRAFEAAKTQLMAAARKWDTLGPRALGALGEIGSASSEDAILAWTKATDGKVKTFDDGTTIRSRQAIDAGRVVGPAAPLMEAPPMYVAPPDNEDPLTAEANRPDVTSSEPAVEDANEVEYDVSTVSPELKPVPVLGEATALDVEAGRAHLARLRADRLKQQEAEGMTGSIGSGSSSHMSEDGPEVR